MSIWSQIPLVRLVIPFALGILLSHYVNYFNFLTAAILFSVFALATLILSFRLKSYQQRWILGTVVNLSMLFFGFCMQLNWQQWHKVPEIKSGEEIIWMGRVEEVTYRSDSSFQLMIKVNQVVADSTEILPFKLSVYYPNSNPPQVGDLVSAESYFNRIADPLNPFQFNYAEFMAKRAVYYQSYVDSIETYAHQASLTSFAAELRNKLLANFKKFGIDGEELSVLTAISLGDKSYLEDHTRDAYAGAGAMHILAVSGLHVGIIYLIFSRLQKFLEKRLWQRILKGIILLAVIWGFAILTGLAPSVQRAGCMFTFIVVSGVLNRNSNVLNSIAGAAFLLLILNPMLLFEVGFQLSFAAVIGIVSLHPIIYDWWNAPNWLADQAWSLMVVSICAQLFTLPFVLYYFHQFPNWFLITNLVVIPLAFAIVAGALIVSVLGLLFNSDFLLASILEALLWSLNQGIKLLQELPFFVTDGIWISLFSAVFLSLFVIMLAYYIHELYYFQLFTSLSFLTTFFLIEFSLNVSQSQINYWGVYAMNDESVYLYKEGLKAEVIYRDSISKYSKTTVENHLAALGVNDVRMNEIKQSIFLEEIDVGTFMSCETDACILFTNKTSKFNEFDDHQIKYIVCNNLPETTGKIPIIIDGSIKKWDYALKELLESSQRVQSASQTGFKRINISH